MSFDWKLYVQLADDLIRTGGTQEAYLHSAISRSYYGVFCIARNFLVSKGIRISRVNTHKFVREEYQKSPNRLEKGVAKRLRCLWRERKDADYEDNVKMDIHRARISYQLAIQTLNRLRKMGAI